MVAYYRIQGGMQAVGDGFNSIVSLSKATGMTPGKPWPSGATTAYARHHLLTTFEERGHTSSAPPCCTLSHSTYWVSRVLTRITVDPGAGSTEWPEGAVTICSNATAAAADYPVRYLQRLTVPKETVRTIINKMRSEDIYAHISHFPSSDHRSAALARQASQLYLLLYYDPELLQVHPRTPSKPVVRFGCSGACQRCLPPVEQHLRTHSM